MPTSTGHDFAGKNKTSKTYDKDWVFVRNRGPQAGGVWMTRRQARGEHEDHVSSMRRAANAAAPVPAAPAATVPIPMPAPTVPLPAAPSITPPANAAAPAQAAAPAIPAWWIGQAYSNPTTEEQKFANAANALLPTLAPEDQRTLANYLAQNNKDVFGGYANTNFGPAPTAITDAIRQQYLSPARAQMAVDLLDRMKQASGVQDMGAGYDYLKNAVNLINQFSNGGVMTREMYQQFTNAVTNLNKNSGQGLSSYANLAQLFNLPQFSAGPLVSNAPNNKLFT